MKIVVETSTEIVRAVIPDGVTETLETDHIIIDGVPYHGIGSSNATVVDITNPPADLKANKYKYQGGALVEDTNFIEGPAPTYDEAKPFEVEIDLLDTLSDKFFDDRENIHDWATYASGENRLWIQALVSRSDSNFSYTDLENFETIIEEDRDDVSNPLSTATATKLLALITELKTKVENPNA